jgi:putative oxidoreductase
MTNDSREVLFGASQSSKALNITLWVLQILAAAVFVLAGFTKLAGAEIQIAAFEKIGLGQWFRYLTGGLEIVCAILLLIPKATAIGPAMLAATLAGAIITHLFIIGGSPIVPIALLLITLTVTWTRRPNLSW